jgi:alkanesulfonate monooxygenase SsuD/methylene tetrahydromethanopterin reductase-like flavin-dependent oxidoreductase (luciferase family)
VPFLGVRQRQAGLEEALAIITGAWGEEPFSFRGTVYAVDSIRVPAPRQHPRPPLMIAGGGERTTLRQVAQLADACNFDELERGGVEVVRRKLAVLRRHCEAVGRPYEEVLRTHYTNWLILAPTEAELRAKVARYFPGNARASYEAAVAQVFPHAAPGIVGRMVVAGTPAQAATYFRARAAAGVQYFVVALYDGTDRETLELLGREVVPHVR